MFFQECCRPYEWQLRISSAPRLLSKPLVHQANSCHVRSGPTPTSPGRTVLEPGASSSPRSPLCLWPALSLIPGLKRMDRGWEGEMPCAGVLSYPWGTMTWGQPALRDGCAQKGGCANLISLCPPAPRTLGWYKRGWNVLAGHQGEA